jgi:hypothetical protein
MRIRDIFEDSKTQWPSDSQAALPNAQVWPKLDNSSPYNSYRFGVAMAGSPNFDMEKSGPTAQSMVTIGYTDADLEITRNAGKIIGVSSKNLTTSGSSEIEDVQTVSPVPQNSGAKRKKRS